MWSRVDDNIPHHPKFVKAGPVASWLWVCGNCYCNRYLTDGFISDDVLETLGNIQKARKYAVILVKAGLWEAVSGGFQVHDFHDHNPRAAEVKAKREADRLRKNSGRNPAGIHEESARNPEVPARAIPIPVPSHPNPDPKKSAEEPRATAQGMAPIIGRNPHLTHSACDPEFSYCVPQAVHHKLADRLAPKHGGDRDAAKEALQAWYPTIWAKLVPGFIMGDAFKFWQAQFDAAFAMPVPEAAPAVAPLGKLTTRLATALANIKREEDEQRDVKRIR